MTLTEFFDMDYYPEDMNQQNKNNKRDKTLYFIGFGLVILILLAIKALEK